MRSDSWGLQIGQRSRVAGGRGTKSLAHEIGHALLHGKPEAGLSRNTVELEAESTAYVVCQSLGLDTSEYSFGYCAAWKGGEAEKVREAIKASGSRIQKASNQILDELEAQTEKTAEPETVDRASRRPRAGPTD